MDGILPIWKPRGITSHDCVYKVRRLFGMKKVGHTGTLDPEAEGVLLVCLGEATKLVPFLMDSNKTYVAEVRLGIATETEDAHGKTIEEVEVTTIPTDDEIKSVLKAFTGEITQIPPMYSAVKVKGKKLYEYARANIEVERPKRKVTIYDIKMLKNERNDGRYFTIHVSCSKGTYIRTLCVDIGKALGYPSHMSDLVRFETGGFKKEDTFTFEALEAHKENGTLHNCLQPMLQGLGHFEQLEIDNETKKRVHFGQKLPKAEFNAKQDPFILTNHNELIAIYETNQADQTEVKPIRVFNVNKSAGDKK